MYKQRKGTFLKTIGVGLVTLFIVTGLGALLDEFGLDPKWSSFVALLVGLIYNFFMQFKIFVIKTKTSMHYMLAAYLVSDLLILTSNQLLINYGINHQKEWEAYLPSNIQDYYFILIRLIVGAFVWIILSYPLRKYWVFA